MIILAIFTFAALDTYSDLLDARSKLEKDLQKMEAEQSKCIRG